jgi:hypothetical protein
MLARLGAALGDRHSNLAMVPGWLIGEVRRANRR